MGAFQNIGVSDYLKRYGWKYGIQRGAFTAFPFHVVNDYENKKILYYSKVEKKLKKKYLKSASIHPEGLTFGTVEADNPIWVYWKQGLDQAPAIIKSCINSIKQNADTKVIVITDDNILSISKAILYGRTIFKNIRKFIIFQLTINLAATSLALIGPFIGVPSPITVIQMLWINMVMDTLAGLAFSYEVPKKEYMMEIPKKRDESIINRYMLNEIVVSSIYLLGVSILFLKLPIIGNMFVNKEHFMTAFFTLFIFLAVNNLFNTRTHRLNIFNHILENKPFIFIVIFIILIQGFIVYSGINIFGTTIINIKELIIIFLISISIIPVDFIRKCIIKKLRGDIGV